MVDSIKAKVEQQMDIIRRGVAEIIPEDELMQKLYYSIALLSHSQNYMFGR